MSVFTERFIGPTIVDRGDNRGDISMETFMRRHAIGISVFAIMLMTTISFVAFKLTI